MKLFDATLDLLSRSMDARMLRHGVLAGNLANAETPGYKPRDVDFSAALAEASPNGPIAGPALPSMPAHEGFIPVAQPAQPAALTANGPSLIDKPGTSSASLDGNRVDTDRTMVDLAQNAIQYSAAAKAAGKKLAMLRYVASDGNA
jgi:flagellar basal-body rod protein FlgB